MCADHRGRTTFMKATIGRCRPSNWRMCLEWRSCGGACTRSSARTETSLPKNVPQTYTVSSSDTYDGLGMKNFIKRWWVHNDTPEFGCSIIAGTMHRMHQLAKRKGMPVCDYYGVGWTSRVVRCVWEHYISVKMLERYVKNDLAVFYVWTTTRVVFFLVISKMIIFPIVYTIVKKFPKMSKKFLGGLVVLEILEINR